MTYFAIISYQLSDLIKDRDILLIYTGTSEYWMKDQNIKYNFLYLESCAAQRIVDRKIKCVGIDTFSIEKYGSKERTRYCYQIQLE